MRRGRCCRSTSTRLDCRPRFDSHSTHASPELTRTRARSHARQHQDREEAHPRLVRPSPSPRDPTGRNNLLTVSFLSPPLLALAPLALRRRPLAASRHARSSLPSPARRPSPPTSTAPRPARPDPPRPRRLSRLSPSTASATRPTATRVSPRRTRGASPRVSTRASAAASRASSPCPRSVTGPTPRPATSSPTATRSLSSTTSRMSRPS